MAQSAAACVTVLVVGGARTHASGLSDEPCPPMTGVMRSETRSSNSAAALKALAAGRYADQGLPRLRFDRVALRVVRDLQYVLGHVPPARGALVVTVTAPIRRPGSTVAQLGARLHHPLRRNFDAMVGGNRVRARILRCAVEGVPCVIVFVHNPEPAPTRPFKLLAACLSSFSRGPHTGASRPRSPGHGN
jgi:hypothetical protein